MEGKIETRNEFLQRYWNYYLLLEQDFLATEQYLTLDELNSQAFSNEYIKQYQAICSEIDVLSKSYCKALSDNFSGKSINAYCKCIIDYVPDFASRVITVKDERFKVTPWKDWSYTETAQNNGKSKIDCHNPDWWQIYNKVKHARTTTNKESGLPYYKLANQKNVLNSLAALFQLEMYYYRLLHGNHFPTEPDMPGPSSILFEIDHWGNSYVMLGTDIAFQMARKGGT